MKIALILSCALLSGCAARVLTSGDFYYMSPSQVCYFASAGGPQSSANAKQDLQRRGHTCTPEDIQIEIARRQAASDANNAAAMMLLNSSRPPAPVIQPPAAPRHCTTQVISGVAYTNCY